MNPGGMRCTCSHSRAPAGNTKFPTTAVGKWSGARNGEIFYRNSDKMMAVEVKTQPSLIVGKPQLLFEGPYLAAALAPYYDVRPDGQRFLMMKSNEQGPAATQINVVLNWFEELKAKVPFAR